MNRRNFFKIAGLGAAGVAVAKVLGIEKPEPSLGTRSLPHQHYGIQWPALEGRSTGEGLAIYANPGQTVEMLGPNEWVITTNTPPRRRLVITPAKPEQWHSGQRS